MNVEIIGIVLTLIGVFAGVYQLYVSRQVELGNFLLRLDDMFKAHQEVHLALRPGGKWSTDEEAKQPQTTEDWAAIEAYMGLFERIKILIDKRIIDADIVRRLYGYRLANIVANRSIRQAKLIDEKDSWQDFIELCALLNIDSEGVCDGNQ
ncbi:MAG: hypothetical protein Kow0077_22830 [Anaerolineae bacterium]